MAGTLYLVSTPIGNLGDMTYRAVDVLRSCDTVLAEDTRRTRILLNHYEIAASDLRSYHRHNEAERTAEVITMLEAGRDVALVADSGTPLVSDPGLRLVRAALDLGAVVTPVPGASAVLAALVGSGLGPIPFTFYGFLPRSGSARAGLMSTLATLRQTSVFFESPERLVRTLEDLTANLGGDRHVVVARELTKVHEEFVRGTLTEVAGYYREHAPRGEVVVCLAVASEPDAEEQEASARALAAEMARAGTSTRDVMRALRDRCGLDRNRAYQLALEATEGGSAG